jgi:hypothetical protein
MLPGFNAFSRTAGRIGGEFVEKRLSVNAGRLGGLHPCGFERVVAVGSIHSFQGRRAIGRSTGAGFLQ